MRNLDLTLRNSVTLQLTTRTFHIIRIIHISRIIIRFGFGI